MRQKEISLCTIIGAFSVEERLPSLNNVPETWCGKLSLRGAAEAGVMSTHPRERQWSDAGETGHSVMTAVESHDLGFDGRVFSLCMGCTHYMRCQGAISAAWECKAKDPVDDAKLGMPFPDLTQVIP